MVLTKCPECSKEISDKDVSCPECAYPIAETKKALDEAKFKKDQEKRTRIARLINVLGFIIIMAAIFTVSNLFEQTDQIKDQTKSSTQTEEVSQTGKSQSVNIDTVLELAEMGGTMMGAAIACGANDTKTFGAKFGRQIDEFDLSDKDRLRFIEHFTSAALKARKKQMTMPVLSCSEIIRIYKKQPIWEK